MSGYSYADCKADDVRSADPATYLPQCDQFEDPGDVNSPVVTLMDNSDGSAGTVFGYNGVQAINCGLIGDTATPDGNCNAGYCGFFTDKSPINMYNFFSALTTDASTLAGPSYLLKSFTAIAIGDEETYTEGDLVQISNCKGSWDQCKPIKYNTCGNPCANFRTVMASSSASPNLAKPAVNSSYEFMTDSNGRQLYCPLLRANVNTGDINFSFIDSSGNTNHNYMNPNSTPLVVGFSGFLGLPNYATLVPVTDGDWFCIEAIFSRIFGGTSSVRISCKYLPPPMNPSLKIDSEGQYVPMGSACSSGNSHALFAVPMLSSVIECFRGTIHALFAYPIISQVQNPVIQFQMGMRKAVQAALTLYVIAFGIRIASSGGELPKKSELFLFILKFVVVLYFAVGTFQNPESADAVSQNSNGLLYYFLQFIDVSAEFANIVMQAANQADNNFCFFPPDLYDQDHQYLALWDSLDCRIASYLGFIDLNEGAKKAFSVLSMIWIYMIGFNIVMTLFLTFFIFFLVGVMVQLLSVYILSMLGLMFLALLAPIFIPMVLFNITKDYFNQWLSQVVACVLQPVVVSASIALIVTVLDQQIYTNCPFKMIDQNAKSPCSAGSNQSCYAVFDKSISSTDSSTVSYQNCQSSLGYWISNTQMSGVASMYSLGGFVSILIPNPGNITNSVQLSNLMTAVLFLFLFYQFSEYLLTLSADLTGGMSFSHYAPSARKMQSGLAKGMGFTRGVGRKILSSVAKKAFKNRIYRNELGRATVVDNAGGGAPGGGGGGGGGGAPTPGATAAVGGGASPAPSATATTGATGAAPGTAAPGAATPAVRGAGGGSAAATTGAAIPSARGAGGRAAAAGGEIEVKNVPTEFWK